MTNNSAALECRHVNKSYGGVEALVDVSFTVRPGSVFGVAGPNGAGKTTLFDVISGRTSAGNGRVLYFGSDVTGRPIDWLAREGLLRTFQTPLSFAAMTARENVVTSALYAGDSQSYFVNAEIERRVQENLDAYGLAAVANIPAGRLPILQRKSLMVATALVASPRLLLLDEPMGGLNKSERVEMLALLRDANARGVTLVVIEHVISALIEIAEQVLILDHGRVIFEGHPEDMLRDPEVVRVYLGHEANRLRGGSLVMEGGQDDG